MQNCVIYWKDEVIIEIKNNSQIRSSLIVIYTDTTDRYPLVIV